MSAPGREDFPMTPDTDATAPRGVQGAIWEWWGGGFGAPGRLLSALLLPLELLFRLGIAVRDLSFRLGLLRPLTASIPVISVGNLAVGGTGKTPLTNRIVTELLEAGARPAVVTRGYGSDEIELHRRWHPEVPVSVARRRVEGVEDAADAGVEIAVLDDGFQHRALARDLDLVLLAAEHPVPIRLIPRGPYREPLRALRRADLVVVGRRVASSRAAERLEAAVRTAAPGARVVRARFEAGDWTELDDRPADPPDGDVLAVASVARPGDFATMVRRDTGADVELMAFPDHHDYTPDDIREVVLRAGGRVVATTEKDAVKLNVFGSRLPPVRVLRLRVVFETGEAEIVAALRSFLAESA